MRYFWTFLWIFLLGQMITYIIGSMSGATYDFKTGVIFSLVFGLIVVLIGTFAETKTTEK